MVVVGGVVVVVVVREWEVEVWVMGNK